MFRLSSIVVALLLIFAGMNFTIASHYCHGALSKTIISLSGKHASCGMDHVEHSTTEATVSSHCCDDELNVYDISSDYAPSDIRYSNYSHSIDYFLPDIKLPSLLLTVIQNKTIKSPPGYFLVSAVQSEDICVFRI